MPSDPTPPAALAASVAAEFAGLAEVIAVALAGSGVTGAADEQSDIDLYVYAGTPVAMTDRVAIATKFATRVEVGNEFWEPGDEWIDTQTRRHVDVMYRTPDWIEEQLKRVLVRHEASVGYSTCFWHSIQHRVTALLASYFDVLFAANELPHPGEKRLLRLAARHCTKIPTDMESHLNALLETAARPASPAIVTHVNALLNNLDDLLANEGLIPVARNADRWLPR